jgi:rRNA maturation RNase YbeY
MDISFNFIDHITLSKRVQLKLYIESIFKTEKKKARSLHFIFCSDPYLLEINKAYLQHNFFTDIITFDLTEPGTKIIEGEIYISVDTVCDNAKRFNVSISKELHRVIFHGVLHLCGYKDKTKKDQLLMTQMEDYYLEKYFLI